MTPAQSWLMLLGLFPATWLAIKAITKVDELHTAWSQRPCLCGDTPEAHQHFTNSTKCAWCDCTRLRRINWLAAMQPAEYEKRSVR